MLALTAVEACRHIAAEMWRGERSHVEDKLGGFTSEEAVRSRLRTLAGPLIRAEDLTAAARVHFQAINFSDDDPLTVLERTEATVNSQLPGVFRDLDSVADVEGSTLYRLTRLLITQCIAGRLGKWAVRHQEIEDAKLARGLARSLGTSGISSVEGLVAAGETLYHAKNYPEAALRFLDADRAKRTPNLLIMAALAFWRAGEMPAALWAIRTCLLEDLETFVDAGVLLRAQMIESSLRMLVDGDGGFDAQRALSMLPDEAQSSLFTSLHAVERVAFEPLEYGKHASRGGV